MESPLASKLRGPHRDYKMSRIAFTERKKRLLITFPEEKEKKKKLITFLLIKKRKRKMV